MADTVEASLRLKVRYRELIIGPSSVASSSGREKAYNERVSPFACPQDERHLLIALHRA